MENRNRRTSGGQRQGNPRRRSTGVTAAQKKKRRLKKRIKRDLILLAMAAVLLTTVVCVVRGVKKVVVTVLDLDVRPEDVTVNHTQLTGDGIEQDKSLLQGTYTWNLRIQHGGETYQVEDLLSEEIDTVLTEIYGGSKEKEYFFEVTNVEEKAEEIVGSLEKKWNYPAKDSEITGFNKENNTFTVGNSASGTVIDRDALKIMLVEALNRQKYDTVIQVEDKEDYPDVTQEDYETLAVYTTNTTNNKLRNINVTLACETVNGTILQAGEEFSYNGVVGERTEEKGYQLAGAYANGEHVQELGGGVCQLSSTLYNAAVDAGLQIVERVGHSYEPNYVTPGEDATVSFGGPDFRFINNSGHSMGIRVSFYDNVVTVEIYGVKILEDGVKQYMKSEKTEDIPLPEPDYVDDPTLPLGTQVEEKAGKMGSKWVTNIVKEQNGEIIEDTYLHTTTYKGTPAVIRQNVTGLDPQTIAALQAQQQAQALQEQEE